jgi:hypothetical protein
MPDYQKAKIYKITSEKTDQVYVGSTVKPITTRYSQHKCMHKAYKENNNKCYVSSYIIFDHGDAKVELVEDFPCATQEELFARERHWTDILPSVNKNRAVVTKEEKKAYYTKEELKEYRHDYYSANKEKAMEYNARIVTCECGVTSTYRHLAKHRRTNRHLNSVKN